MDKDICRICLEEFSKCFSVFSRIGDENNIEQDISSMLISVANVEVDTNDPFPKTICEDCLDKLNTAYHFKIQCEQSYQDMQDNKKHFIDIFKIYDNLDEKFTEYVEIEEESYRNAIEKVQKLSDVQLLKVPKENTEIIEMITINENIPTDFEQIPQDVKNKLTELNLLKVEGKKFTDLIYNRPNMKADELNKTRKYLYQQIVTQVNEDDESVVIVVQNDDNFAPKDDMIEDLDNSVGEVKSENVPKKRVYMCDMCGKEFITSYGLKYHQTTHKPDRPYICTVPNCKASFQFLKNLERHKAKHLNLRNYMCSICGKMYNARNSLWTHMKYHKAARFQCANCGQTFFHSSHLTVHMLRHKGGNKRLFTCEICGRSYRSNNALQKHSQKFCAIGKKPRYRFTRRDREEYFVKS